MIVKVWFDEREEVIGMKTLTISQQAAKEDVETVLEKFNSSEAGLTNLVLFQVVLINKIAQVAI
ncbi:hypothetical protein [Liquorilactobacillus nagelii]|uniref:hypothetical protein n=1 Tax=Liquorilactobacillus nagelii TaxID=82688 RepID=UPI001CCAA469|nr:hypothetical protein [Liquorilactobacillus nagelii]ULQ50095.1 hypothetical protein J6864_03460 [Liquorilactobacillus nagelii]